MSVERDTMVHSRSNLHGVNLERGPGAHDGGLYGVGARVYCEGPLDA
jgi:hypothetical protein